MFSCSVYHILYRQFDDYIYRYSSDGSLVNILVLILIYTGSSDYTAVVNSLVTFTPGSAINSRQNIMNILITNDNIAECTETFFMTLTAVAGLGNPQIDPQLSVATIIIIDDDGEYNTTVSTFINVAVLPISVVTDSKYANLVLVPVVQFIHSDRHCHCCVGGNHYIDMFYRTALTLLYNSY